MRSRSTSIAQSVLLLCPYRRAEAKGILEDYKHPPAFDEETQEVLKSIYEDHTSDELLERCLGANTQNNNESYNSCVWNIVPKHKFVAKQIFETAAYSAACIFNEGFFPILKAMQVMQAMQVRIGPQAKLYAEKVNNLRIERAELQASEASKEHRTALRNARILQNDYYEEEEGIVYGVGIAE